MNLTTPSLEHRDFPASGFDARITDKTAGIIEVRANVLEQEDSYDSIFCSPCFDAVVREQRFLPYLLLDHDFPDKMIGRVTETNERRDAGVWQWARAQLNMQKQLAQEALSDIDQRFRDVWSVGFASDPKAEKFETRNGRTVRLIKKLLVWPDLSSVLVPGGDGTATLSVRASGLLTPPLSAAPEHVGTLLPDGDFEELRRHVTSDEADKPYVAYYGHRRGAGWVLSSMHYPAQDWSATEARAHCLAAGGHEFSEAAGLPRSHSVALTPAGNERRDAPEGSYEDLSQDLRQVIDAWLGGNWQDWEHGRYFNVNHTMPSYVVIEIAGLPGSDDSTTFLQFPYSLGADGEPVLSGDPTEVTPQYVPVEPGARSGRMTREIRAVSQEAWNGAAGNYADTDAYCRACLIDENPDGEPKKEALCKLPVREPSGALNADAVRAAAAALGGARTPLKASAAAKALAARKLEALKKEAGIDDGKRSLSGPAETTSAALDTARRKLRLASYALATLGVEPAQGTPPEVRHDSMSRKDKTKVQGMHDQAGAIHTATAALGADHSPDTCGMDAPAGS